MLPLFFVAARLGRSRPRLLLALAVLVYVLAVPVRLAMLEMEWLPALATEGTYRCTIYLLWYIAGFVLRDRISGFATRAPILVGPLLLGVSTLSTTVMFFGEHALVLERTLHAIADVSGVFGPIVLMPALARISRIARLGEIIGTRTLEIYMIHPLVLNAVVVLYPSCSLGEALRGSWVSDLLLIPVVSTLALGAGVLAQMLARKRGLRWLFSAPGGGEKSNISPPTPR